MKPTNLLRLILILVTLSALQSAQLCSSALADDAEDVLGTDPNAPIIDLNPKGGARTTQGMAPDDGADGLVNTGGGGLVFGGGGRSEGMAPDDGADVLGNSGGPVVDLDTNDGPAEPNESAENPPCAAASSMFAPALAAMGENPCP